MNLRQILDIALRRRPDHSDLLRRLAEAHPWSLSREGLDDHCRHCGCEDHEFSGEVHWWHYSDCVWIEARRALDMGLDRHGVLDHPAPEPEDWEDADPDFDWTYRPAPFHLHLPTVRAPRGGITFLKPPSDIP